MLGHQNVTGLLGGGSLTCWLHLCCLPLSSWLLLAWVGLHRELVQELWLLLCVSSCLPRAMEVVSYPGYKSVPLHGIPADTIGYLTSKHMFYFQLFLLT